MSSPNTQTPREVMLREMGVTPIWTLRGELMGLNPDPVETHTALAQAVTAEPSDVLPPIATSSMESIADRATRISDMTWGQVTEEIAGCTACKLYKTRTKTVPGVGNIHPKWMVIGEAPGENEDKTGEPFVGRAGQLLDAMLHAAAKSRKRDVFITNIVKCRPPGNRDPEADEIAACAPLLNRQIALAKPKLFLAVGKFAGQQLLGSNATVAAMRGAPGKRFEVPVVVTYHPSYLLRVPAEKAKSWDDLATALSIVQ